MNPSRHYATDDAREEKFVCFDHTELQSIRLPDLTNTGEVDAFIASLGDAQVEDPGIPDALQVAIAIERVVASCRHGKIPRGGDLNRALWDSRSLKNLLLEGSSEIDDNNAVNFVLSVFENQRRSKFVEMLELFPYDNEEELTFHQFIPAPEQIQQVAQQVGNLWKGLSSALASRFS